VQVSVIYATQYPSHDSIARLMSTNASRIAFRLSDNTAYRVALGYLPEVVPSAVGTFVWDNQLWVARKADFDATASRYSGEQSFGLQLKKIPRNGFEQAVEILERDGRISGKLIGTELGIGTIEAKRLMQELRDGGYIGDDKDLHGRSLAVRPRTEVTNGLG
jgi:DNA segregation ATPase FtsK/SpoIIIE-like protein